MANRTLQDLIESRIPVEWVASSVVEEFNEEEEADEFIYHEILARVANEMVGKKNHQVYTLDDVRVQRKGRDSFLLVFFSPKDSDNPVVRLSVGQNGTVTRVLEKDGKKVKTLKELSLENLTDAKKIQTELLQIAKRTASKVF